MLTILSVIGTRPEAIKMAPVIRELGRHPDRLRSLVCATGQHQEMLRPILELFAIRPDYDLGLMQPGQTLASLTARLVTALDEVVGRLEPDWILAQGDTTTVLVSSLVAYYHQRRFGHVEAGLRTGDPFRPFPEEMNRRIADSLAALLFAPTRRAADQLLREGYPASRIHVTGNTVIDALLEVAARPEDPADKVLSLLPTQRRLVLITAHRRESFGEPFRQLCLALRELAARFAGTEVHFVYPVHLNPNVRQPVNEILAGLPNFTLLEPLDYAALVRLMKRCVLILTDSGGIQEEAPSFQVPVLVMRDTTERPEGVEAGLVKLVGTQRERIVAEAEFLLRDPSARARMTGGPNPYGDGQAAQRIVSLLLETRTVSQPAAS
jgi:UDP-N-acetylglucosamine 2-epimerase